jgi:GT2 family glycosyltransferase
VFEKVGYFDLSFDACEDVEFNYRCAKAGFKSFISKDLSVYYYPRTSLRSLFRQMIRYGIGRFRLAHKHPGTLSISSLLPSFLTAGLPILGLFCFLRPVLLYLFAALSLAYACAILLFSLVLAFRNGWAYFIVLPPVYLAIHAGLGYGFLRELAFSTFKASMRFFGAK